jgi:hypothetical protein
MLGKGVPAMNPIPLPPSGRVFAHKLILRFAVIHVLKESIDLLKELPGTPAALIFAPKNISQQAPFMS